MSNPLLEESAPCLQTKAGNSETQPVCSLEKHDSFPSSTWTLLLRVARAAVEGASIDTSAIPLHATGWATLASDADAHGLAPLAHLCLQPHRHAAPEATMQQLEALALRHRMWHRERTIALADILQAPRTGFDRRDRLKGAALAWSIYASPALRPMGDIDLMVPV